MISPTIISKQSLSSEIIVGEMIVKSPYRSSVQVGAAMQRRLAWPARRDDARASGSVSYAQSPY